MSELTAKHERDIRCVSEDFTNNDSTERRLYLTILKRIVQPILDEWGTDLDVQREQEEKSARDYWQKTVDDLELQIAQSDALFTVCDNMLDITNKSLPILFQLRQFAGTNLHGPIDRILTKIRKVQEAVGKGILPK